MSQISASIFLWKYILIKLCKEKRVFHRAGGTESIYWPNKISIVKRNKKPEEDDYLVQCHWFRSVFSQQALPLNFEIKRNYFLVRGNRSTIDSLVQDKGCYMFVESAFHRKKKTRSGTGCHYTLSSPGGGRVRQESYENISTSSECKVKDQHFGSTT